MQSLFVWFRETSCLSLTPERKAFLGHALPKVQDLFANATFVCIVPRNFVPHFDTGKESFLGHAAPTQWTSTPMQPLFV